MKVKKKTRASGILGGAISLTVAAIAVKVLGLVYKIPLSHMLTDEGMGYFNAAYTVYGCLYLICTAGVPKAISILTAEQDAFGLVTGKRRLFRICLLTFGALGAALAFLLAYFSVPIGRFIGNAPAAFSMLAIAPSLLFVSLGGVIRGYLNGHAAMWPIAASQVLEGLCKLILGLGFAKYAVSHAFSLPLVAAFTILGITVGSFLSFVYLALCVRRVGRGDSADRACDTRHAPRATLGGVVRVALPVTVSAGILSMTNLLDLGLIMKRLSHAGLSVTEASALYGNYTTLAVPMFNLAAGMVASVAMAILPHLTKRYVLDRRDEFRALFRKALEITVCFVIPFSFALILFGEPILALLFEDGSAAMAAPLLATLSPAIVFMAALTVVNTALEAAGMPRAPLVSMLVGSVAKLAVSYVLIGQEQIGILGAPIGTVTSYAVSLTVSLILLHTRGDISVSVFACFVRSFINATGAVLGVFFLYIRLCSRMSATAGLFVCMLIGVPLYLALSLFTGVLPLKRQKNMVIFDK